MSGDQPTRPRLGAAWAAAFAVLGLAVIVTLGGLYVFRSLRQLPGDLISTSRDALDGLGELARSFREGTVETRFAQYATGLTGTNNLQIATLSQTEVYTREDRVSVLWGQLPLPDVVVAATVPVEYTYFLDLRDRWRFELSDGVLRVTAPEIRHNRPAMDVSALHFEVRESSLFRDEEGVMEQLKAGLSAYSNLRAKQHIQLVRDTGRRQTEEFVRTWIASQFEDEDVRAIEVIFADEVPRLSAGQKKG